jgi:hypothetical protein
MGTIDHFGLRSTTAAETMVELKSRGAYITVPPRTMQLPNGGIEFFYLAGPRGAYVEMVEREPQMP